MVTAHILNDPESHIGTFFHLQTYPNAEYALQTLKKVASLVKPIMRKHRFRISKLAEFYPEMQPNLLGLNTSFPGSDRLPFIQLRLRQPHNPSVFLDYEAVVQTMLHELTHCIRGPHDDKFWEIFKSLQGELDTLRYSGYTGEGFMGKGESLGGIPKGLSSHEAKKRARESAERRRKGDQGRGRILGSGSLGPIRWIIEDIPGSASKLRRRDGGEGSSTGRNTGRSSAPPATDTRSPYATPDQLAADAALKRKWFGGKDKEKEKERNSQTKSPLPPQHPPASDPTTGVCSGIRVSTTEQVDREIAQMHGFESVADMESANERAIMQAAIELLEEADREEERLNATEAGPGSGPGQPSSSNNRPIDIIDLTSSSPPQVIKRTRSAPVRPHPHPTSPPPSSPGWSCPMCTYVNEESHLQCSVCGVERNTRPHEDDKTKAQITALNHFERRQSRVMNHNTTPPQNAPTPRNDKGKGRNSQILNTGVTMNGQPTWKCHSCGWLMGQEWWSCGNCGSVKLQS